MTGMADVSAASSWGEIYARLLAADRESPLGPEDLARLATAAYLTGREPESAGLWARAHHGFQDRGQPAAAARAAVWLAYGLLDKGELAQGSGWLARARRLLDECGQDCVERGYLLLPEALRSISEGDYERAAGTFRLAARAGDRFGDADLIALARHGEGRALIRLGRTAAGLELLDEAMVAVTAGEVSPLVAGDVYCGVISGCQEVFDWRRAREWTAALARWCDGQPDLVPFRGQCLLHRAEVLQLRGDWRAALDEARRACERLSDPAGQAGLGAAFYQLAEVHRLRGELAEAEEAYRQASLHGRRPQPGLALLRLARGEVAAAVAAIAGAVNESAERRTRARLLPAQVEIALATHDVAMARTVAGELAAIAAEVGAPYLRAASAQAAGSVCLAEGDAQGALAVLREAEAIWRDLEAPYEAARTRVLIAVACRELGDECAADLELEAARAAFRQLEAAHDLAEVGRLSRAPAPPKGAGGLTARELQVVRLVAAGATNRAIAGRLRISEKTVARHLSNIFVKLGVPSRAAATAYAYEHRLVHPGAGSHQSPPPA
jgi:DNA-binding CsgD family transcriptional regulator